MREKLEAGSFTIYWGTATTGRPHIAYFVPISKIADFLRAGCKVKILFADLHAYLDNQKAPWELLEQRVNYYQFVIKQMLMAIGVSLDRLEFVRGTDYQLSKEYTLDVYRFSSMVTEHDAKKAGAEVVKQVASPLLSGLLYPCLQALDEKYLQVDGQFGGIDQRKIFTLAEKYMPRLGSLKCVHFMNPMVPGLTGQKMSASDPNSKIDLLDSAAQVKKKVSKAFCKPGEVDGNGILAFAKMVLFPIYNTLEIVRKEEHGGNLTYNNYQSLEEDYAAERLWPNDLKACVINYLTQLLKPIRESFEASIETQKMAKLAYPDEQQIVVTQKKGAPAAKNNISALKLVVGRVVKAEKHPDADSLYVEQIDVGESEPRTIVSGLVKYVPLDEFEGSLVVVCANLKPSKLRGVASKGMVIAAAKDDQVELVRPHADSKPGDVIFAEGFEGEPLPQIDASKRSNPFKKVKESLQTNADLVAVYQDVPLRTQAGVCTVKSLASAQLG